MNVGTVFNLVLFFSSELWVGWGICRSGGWSGGGILTIRFFLRLSVINVYNASRSQDTGGRGSAAIPFDLFRSRLLAFSAYRG